MLLMIFLNVLLFGSLFCIARFVEYCAWQFVLANSEESVDNVDRT